MARIFLFLALLAAAIGGTYAAYTALIERGAREARATIEADLERQKAAAIAEAAEHYRLTVQALEAQRRDSERQAAEHEAELERLRNERAGDTDSGDIVFDQRWAEWLRGNARPPGIAGAGPVTN